MLQYGYIIDSEILLSDKTNNKILIVPGALLNRTSGSLLCRTSPPQSKKDGSGGLSNVSLMHVSQSFSGWLNKL